MGIVVVLWLIGAVAPWLAPVLIWWYFYRWSTFYQNRYAPQFNAVQQLLAQAAVAREVQQRAALQQQMQQAFQALQTQFTSLPERDQQRARPNLNALREQVRQMDR